VASSREASFHLPAIEAMASGLPVVVRARAGVSKLVEEGRHALVLPDAQDVEEVDSTIKRALDEELAEQFAAKGRELADRLTWDVNTDRTAELIMRGIITPRFIVLAPDAFGTGGIERTTRTLIRTLGERFGADRVGVLSVWGGRVDLPARILHRGRRSGGGRPVPPADRATFAISALHQARRWRRGLVIVACHPHLAPVALAAGRIAGSRVAVWCHGDEVWGPTRLSVRYALRKADLVFAPSRFTADQVGRWIGLDRKPTVVPHSLPPELVLRRSAPVPGRVLAVARLEAHDRYKGIDTLIEAWPNVLKAHPEAELVVVGAGGDRRRLERLAASLATDGHVRFTGWIDDRELQELYRTSAVFALPTAATVGSDAAGEGFGLVFVEAAAAGLPVVAGRSGAVPEVIEDGRTGLLVEPHDPLAVADAIGRLLRDPQLRTRLGRAARSRARERFSYEAFGDRVETLLGDLAFGPET
jgi:phosphatidyl-myo-inositol dimannoside synthase